VARSSHVGFFSIIAIEEEMTIRIFAGAIVLAALLPPLFPARAAVRIGEAEVREGPHGGPCFTIAAREERRGTQDFRGVTVWEGQRLMWKMTMPRDRTFALTFGTCVPYGGKVAALPHTPAADLQPGVVYYLRIDAREAREARAGAARARPLAYDARFCLARRRDGALAVQQVGRATASHAPAGPRMAGCPAPGD
jgi:hypothetical protein